MTDPDRTEKQFHRDAAKLQRRIDHLEEAETTWRQTHKSLQENENRYRAIIENSMEGIWHIDLNGYTIYSNRAMCEILEIEGPEELAGISYHRFFTPESLDIMKKEHARRPGGEASRYEVEIVGKRGGRRDILISGTPMFSDRDELQGLIGVFTDITDRKRTELALRESEAKYRLLFDSADIMVSVYNRKGVCLLMNRKVADLFGCKPEELIGKSFKELHPLAANEYTQRIRQAIDTGVSKEYEDAVEFPQGTRWLLTKVHPVPDAKGVINTAQIISHDITVRKRMEEALIASERNYREIFDKTNDAIFIHDIDGKILDVNQATCDVFGFEREETFGKRIQDFSQGESPYSQKEAVEYVKKAFEEGPQRFAWLGRRKNGDIFWIEVSLKHAVIGGQDRIIAAARDISERRKAEEELNKHREKLEDLVEERTKALEEVQEELLKQERLAVLGQLTATVSHELRNPLGVIRTSSFYLQQKLKSREEKINKHLKRIEDQVEICDSIVGELLEFTRGRHSHTVRGEINPLLEQILDDIQENVDVKIKQSLDEQLPKVFFDAEKMRRVVVNLMDNALQAVSERKLTEEDETFPSRIEVVSKRTGGGVLIMVKDNGVGMSGETMEKAFEPLFTTKAKGTGLGLANVRKIIEEHSGSVSLESNRKKGTTAIILLPAVDNG